MTVLGRGRKAVGNDLEFASRSALTPCGPSRPAALGMQHDGPRCHAAPVADVTYAQLDQVAGSKLAVDGEVEQRQFRGDGWRVASGPESPSSL